MSQDIKQENPENNNESFMNRSEDKPFVHFEFDDKKVILNKMNDEKENEIFKYKHDDLKKNQTTKERVNQEDELFKSVHLQKKDYSVPIRIEKQTDKGIFFDANKPFFSLKIALTHARANRVYKEVLNQQAFKNQQHAAPENICPCCSFVAQGDDALISVFSSSLKEIAHLGPTYPLYFQFMRYSMGLLTIILAISGIYNLVKNKEGNRCNILDKEKSDTSQDDCKVSFITEFAASNRQLKAPDETFSILNLVTCIALIIYSTFFRYRQIKAERDIDKSDVSVSDYSVFINQIPHNKNRKQIQEFLESQVPNIKVMKIVQAFKLKEYNNLKDLLQYRDKTKLEKQEILKKIEEIEKQCFKEENIEQIFSGACYVSFEREEQTLAVINHFKVPEWKRIFSSQKNTAKTFEGNQLTITKAHEPGDTNWENIEISTKDKIVRRSFTFFLSLCCIVGSFIAIFFISKTQDDIRKNEQNQNKVQGYTILGSVIILIINQVIQILIQIFAHFEAYNCKTDTVISISKKSGIVQFINSTIVQFSVNIIQNGLDIWINGGLVNDITLLLISNAFVPALISFLSIENILKWVNQKLFLKKNIEEQRNYTQMYVHTLFELPIFNPAACFASAANTLLLSAFYSWIVPLGIPFSILSLILQMMVNKYNLLRKQSVPIPYGSDLPSEMIDFYFQIINLFYSIGCLSFELILFKNTHICTIIQVILSGLFYILPINEYLDQKLSLVSNFIESLTYSDAKIQGHFYSDYDRKNPILKNEAIKRYIDFILDNEKDPLKKQYFMKIFYPDPTLPLTKTQIFKLSEYQTDYLFKETIGAYQKKFANIELKEDQNKNCDVSKNSNNEQLIKDDQIQNQNLKQVEQNKILPL